MSALAVSVSDFFLTGPFWSQISSGRPGIFSLRFFRSGRIDLRFFSGRAVLVSHFSGRAAFVWAFLRPDQVILASDFLRPGCLVSNFPRSSRAVFISDFSGRAVLVWKFLWPARSVLALKFYIWGRPSLIGKSVILPILREVRRDTHWVWEVLEVALTQNKWWSKHQIVKNRTLIWLSYERFFIWYYVNIRAYVRD